MENVLIHRDAFILAAAQHGRKRGAFLAAVASAIRVTRNTRRTTAEEGTEAGIAWARRAGK
jgi:hypothetical protein